MRRRTVRDRRGRRRTVTGRRPGGRLRRSPASITTFKRADDGKTQLQIDGHPLYTFAGDTKPGDTNGQKIIDKWYVTTGAGAKVGDTS